MSCKQWLNKKEVLRDLGEIGGRYTGDNITTVRDKPPVMPSEEVDIEDMLSTYGGGDTNMFSCSSNKPDLNNIAEMINMVREIDDLPSYNTEQKCLESEDVTVVISKLNPNVQEFVPSGSRTTDSDKSSVHSIKNSEPDMKSSTKVMEKNAGGKEKDLSDVIKDENANGKEKIDKTETEDSLIKENLKSIVLSIHENESIQKKLEKNAALFSLLKMCTAAAEVKEREKKPILRTPEYFQSKLVEDVVTIDTHTEATEVVNINTQTDATEDADVDRKELEESIRKVSNWLKPEPKPTPVEQKENKVKDLGRKITYQKKVKSKLSVQNVNKANNSPSSPNRSNMSSPSSSRFKPSQQANELYEKLVKAKEVNDHPKDEDSVWSAVLKEMKKRDDRHIEMLTSQASE